MSDLDEFLVLEQLRSVPQIFDLLSGSTKSLALQKKLRSDYPPEVVRAALTLHDLRARAERRFSRAAEMWFDPTSLEQATAETVAMHKAARFATAMSSGRWPHVIDFCCGAGSDAIALARQQCRVQAWDISPACCLRTQWNAAAYGVQDHIETCCGDVLSVTDRSGLLHVDPDRRPGAGRRVLRVEDCVPGLDVLQRWIEEFPGGAIKLSPASNFGGKFPGCEIELISLYGECREATVWFGQLAGDCEWRATVLPSGDTIAADPLSAWTNVGPLGAWLFDPDPAVVRSGLVDVLAEQLGAHRLDDAEEYLTADGPIESPFVQSFEVLEDLPNNDREIRHAVRRHEIGQIEIKCRHIPVQAEAVRRKLPLQGTRPGVLVYTRQAGRARAVLCRRI